jgi:hypothetical protein
MKKERYEKGFVLKSIVDYVANHDNKRERDGDSYITKSSITARRMQVCISMMKDGASFSMLRKDGELGIRSILDL